MNTAARRQSEVTMAPFSLAAGGAALVSEKYNKSKHPLYNIYHDIKRRCKNLSHPSYKNYGGRGIKVCERWLHSFENFLEDMGDKPTPKHTIDRIDNDGNYEPSNCRWVDYTTQNHNKRANCISGARGVHKSNQGWKVQISRYGKGYYGGYYKTIKEAKTACLELEKKIYV